MKFDLTSPCSNCPFRSDTPTYLRLGRVIGILRDLTTKHKTFACHKTTGAAGKRVLRIDQQHCAGALILVRRSVFVNKMIRLAEILGLSDPSKLNMKAPVYASAQEMIEFIAARCPRSQEAQYLKLGKWLSTEPFGASDLADIADMLKGIHNYKPGECYMNAWKIATSRRALKFCEGFAAGMWPVPHAWVTYKGRAIDVTWPTDWRLGHVGAAKNIGIVMDRVEHNLKNCSYLGVEVPANVIRDHGLECGTYSPLFDRRFIKRWPEFEKSLDTGKFPCYTKSSSHTEK